MRLIATAGAALIVAGFFLPWVDGSAEFASRDFTGFDLARLLRNLEIVASSSNDAGKFTLTAVVLYLVPALAVNGAVMAWLADSPRLAGGALLIAAVYAAGVLAGVAAISSLGDSDAERVLGGLMAGFGCSGLGAALALLSSLLLVRAQAPAAAEEPPAQAPS